MSNNYIKKLSLLKEQYEDVGQGIEKLNDLIMQLRQQYQVLEDLEKTAKKNELKKQIQGLKVPLDKLADVISETTQKYHFQAYGKTEMNHLAPSSHPQNQEDYDLNMLEKDEAYLGKILEEADRDAEENQDISIKHKYMERRLDNARNRLQARESYVKELFREIEETNTELDQQKEYVENAFSQLDQAYDNVQAGFHYAKRFQEAMLPRKDKFDQLFKQYFIFEKPRDIVSGDFYWLSEVEEGQYIIALLDCTGHGVPGAFMTLLGYDLLDNIVNHQKVSEPSDILKRLHVGVRRALNQHETKNRDGMDVALCRLDLKNRTLAYAGAHNPLLLIQNGQFHWVKANNFAVGGYEKEGKRDFTQHQFSLGDDANFYLYSDGYQDQMGGPNGRRFMASRLRRILFEMHTKPFHKQHKILKKVIEYWMKTQKQMDDMLIMGFQV